MVFLRQNFQICFQCQTCECKFETLKKLGKHLASKHEAEDLTFSGVKRVKKMFMTKKPKETPESRPF